MGWSGRVVIAFTVCEDGSVEEARVVESSGRDLLDNNAIEVLARAAPFPRITSYNVCYTKLLRRHFEDMPVHAVVDDQDLAHDGSPFKMPDLSSRQVPCGHAQSLPSSVETTSGDGVVIPSRAALAGACRSAATSSDVASSAAIARRRRHGHP